MNIKAIQQQIKSETGLTVTARKLTGSMLGYVQFTVRDRNKEFVYPYGQNYAKKFQNLSFGNNHSVTVFFGNSETAITK